MWNFLNKLRKKPEPVNHEITEYYLGKSLERQKQVDRIVARHEKRIRQNGLAEGMRHALRGGM